MSFIKVSNIIAGEYEEGLRGGLNIPKEYPNRYQDMSQEEQAKHCKDYAEDLFNAEMEKEEPDFGFAMEMWEEAGGIY